MEALARSVFRTICWFEVADYAPTAFEIWKWLYSPPTGATLEEVMRVLEEMDTVETLDGYWGRRGSGLATRVGMRRERYADALRKMKRVRRAACWFRLFPWVEMVAVGNTLAWWNTRPESDIDLFIVCAPRTVWLTRLCLVTPFAFLGWRPGPGVQDPLCFSFFVSRNTLDLRPLRLPDEDPYFAYWLRSLVPVFDRGEVYVQLQKANAWAMDEIPNAPGRSPHPVCTVASSWLLAPSWLAWFEPWVRRLQEGRLPEKIRSMMNKDTRVVLNDDVLKFHDQDRRAEIRDAWNTLSNTTV
jgi:hypothetical protein